jgi:predicted DNA-binding protein
MPRALGLEGKTKRVTLILPEELDGLIEAYMTASGKMKAEIIAAAVEEYFRNEQRLSAVQDVAEKILKGVTAIRGRA